MEEDELQSGASGEASGDMVSEHDESVEEIDEEFPVESIQPVRRTTHIFDERVETRCVERLDLLTRQQADRNVEAVCALASVLLLQPECVCASAQYWLAHYSDPTMAERDWFGDLCHSVLYRAPSLSLVGDEGIPIAAPLGAQPPAMLMRCMGGEQQRVPLSHYQPTPSTENPPWHTQLMVSLGHLLQSQNHAFVQRSDDGIQNELALGGFVYDALLREFWEPSLALYTLVLLYTLSLRYSCNAKCTADWLPHYGHAMQSLHYDAIEWDRVPLQGEALQRLQRDVVALQSIESADGDELTTQLEQLWQTKAEWCCVEQELRTKRVLTRL